MLTASVVLALTLAPVPTVDDYVGRWNVLITDAEDTFASGGFEIAKKDGVLSGGIVWRWGSFLPVKSIAVEDGMLHMVREETAGKPETFVARIEDGTLRGHVTYPDGKVHHFDGRRAPLLLSKKAPAWGEPVSLFDGKTLDGWKLRDTKKKNGWAVVNGELAVVDPKDNADLLSERTFSDLKLHLEFNVDKKSNSGVYLRGRYEVQILDNPDAKMAVNTHGCGGVYSRIAPKFDATKPAGEWQTFDITLVGRQVTVVLNGRTIEQGVVDGITGGATSPWEDKPGPIMLQGDHGKVRFRNIVVTPAR